MGEFHFCFLKIASLSTQIVFLAFSLNMSQILYTNLKVGSFRQHSAGINCLSLLKSVPSDGFDYLFTGSRDSTLKRWALVDDMPSFSAKFESHVDWVVFIFLMNFSYDAV